MTVIISYKIKTIDPILQNNHYHHFRIFYKNYLVILKILKVHKKCDI